MRALGLDLGSRRIGVAICDSAGRLATPLEVIRRARRPADDHRAIARLVLEVDAEVVVVGLPLSLDGSQGPAATRALAEVDDLRAALTVPVETHDERLSTVEAERALMAQQLDAEQRRTVVDKVAAAVILQSWLDGPASTGDRP